MLDEAEGAMVERAFGPLRGTMLDEDKGANEMDPLIFNEGSKLGFYLVEGSWRGHSLVQSLGLHSGHCLAQCLMKLKGDGWTYTGPLLCTLLDEAEGANDGRALGPLLGTKL